MRVGPPFTSYSFRPGQVVSVDASSVIHDHSDVAFPEIGWLLLNFIIIKPLSRALHKRVAGSSRIGGSEMNETRSGRLAWRKLSLLASAATLAGAMLFAVPGGYLGHGGTTPLMTTARAAELSAQADQAGPRGFADIVKNVKGTVMSVRVRLKNATPSLSSDEGSNDQNNFAFPKGSPFERFFRDFGFQNQPNGRNMQRFGMAQGAAFFISPDGYAVTNNHVVDHAQSIEVATEDGKTYTAKVIGTDAKTDLALLKVEGGSGNFPYVQFADHTPQIGDWVIAVGSPYGLAGTVTAGIVSARGRDIGTGPYDDFIQIDATVNRGNSGGPAFDESGHVVGVTTAIYSPSGGSIGIGFAIPADTVRSVVDQIKEHGSVTRGWLGVRIQTVTPEIADSLGMKKASGALVAEPEPNSPAANAGMTSGDVIQSVNGQEVKNSGDLARKVAVMRPGNEAKFGIIHNGSEKTATVKLGTMPNQSSAQNEQTHSNPENTAPLGLTIAPADSVPGKGKQGVVVTEVNPDGPAAERGIHSGDVILDVAGKAVNNPSDVRQAVSDARSGGKHDFLMRIKSGNSTRFVALPVATS
jgi:serine protease Do